MNWPPVETNNPPPLKTFTDPPAEFFFGHARMVFPNVLDFYLSFQKKYGDYIRLQAPFGNKWYLLTHPSAVEHVLQKNQQNYEKPDLFVKPTSLLVGQGMLTSSGDFWMKQRRLAQPAFHKKMIITLASTIEQCITDCVESLTKKDGAQIDLHQEMMRLSLRIAGLTLFGADTDESAREFGAALRVAFAEVSRRMRDYPFVLPMWMPVAEHRNFKEAKAQLDHLVLDIIARRKRGGEHNNDLLQMLLDARDDQTGEPMQDQHLKDEIITLLVAGHDTTAAALSWTFFALQQNPDVREQLENELDDELNGRSARADDLERLPYTRMVLDEALRLYPPAWGQPRRSIKDDTIDGYWLPAGSMISLCQYVTHRHEDFWQQPDRFLPERFLAQQAEKRPKFAYFPFGGGSRLCIGQQFALLEGQLALANLAQKFRFDLVPGAKVEPDPTFTLMPKDGLAVTVRKR